jgi:hypothetical protein
MNGAHAEESQMARNKFEQVDEAQPDAITLSLTKEGDREAGIVIFPASASGGRIPGDQVSPRMAAKDAFRHAVKIANEMKVAVVVMDPHGVWQSEWGDLARYEDGDEPASA